MRTIDIPIRESITYSNSLKEEKECYIRIGNKEGCTYWSYIYFTLHLPMALIIQSATLVLFKIPIEKSLNKRLFEERRHKGYCVIPTLEYMSEYSYCYKEPELAIDLGTEFEACSYRAYTEIDITAISRSWFEDKLENKGILLNSHSPKGYLQYAAAHYGVRFMRPFVRIKYKPMPMIVPGQTMEFPISIKKL